MAKRNSITKDDNDRDKRIRSICQTNTHNNDSTSHLNARSIGFLKLNMHGQNSFEYYHPIIKLDVDEVPLTVRKRWHSNKKDSLPSDSETCIVYQYGLQRTVTEEDDHSFQFHIIHQSEIIPFEEGVKDDFDCIPSHIMNKLRLGQPLEDAEVELIEALEMLKKELRKEPIERVEWMANCKDISRDELIKDLFDDDDDDGDNDDGDNDDGNNDDGENDDGDDDLIDEEDPVSDQEEQDNRSKLKNYIASLVPDDVKNDFGRVGFANYDEFLFPVIQINPLELAPSCFRSEWMRMFRTWDLNGRVGSFKRLIYWYGQGHGESEREMSLIDHSDTISYYDGCEQIAQEAPQWNIEEDLEKYLKHGITEAENDLELSVERRVIWLKQSEVEKRDFLMKIPPEMTNDFRSLGWVAQGRIHLPVVILSPFDVTGGVKEEFINILNEGMTADKPIKRLVLWYGTRQKHSDRAFAFISSAQIIPYQEGLSRNLHIIPEKIQRKINKKSNLTQNEFLLFYGLKMMTKDARLSREERPNLLILPNNESEIANLLNDD